jgi:pyruvate-ferredoxin/flavodoxin oxidoreductase
MTFADFACTEVRFRKHFRTAPPDTWNDRMVPLDEFLALDAGEREERLPYIWSLTREGQLSRLLVDEVMVRACEDRRDFWTMLRGLAGVGRPEVSREVMEADVRQEVVARLAQGLMQLASGSPEALTALAAPVVPPSEAGGARAAAPAPGGNDYMAPWIDTDRCTTCDECIRINPAIFAYNAQKKAYVKDPLAGPYKDLVRAAERCTARIIHPGLPKDRSGKDIEKWVARGGKFN